MTFNCHPSGTNSRPSMSKVQKITTEVNLCSNLRLRTPSTLSALLRAVLIKTRSPECLCQTHHREEILTAWKTKTYSHSYSLENRPDLHSYKSRNQTSIITCLGTRKNSLEEICRKMSWQAIDIWTSLDCPRSSRVSKALSCRFQRQIWGWLTSWRCHLI